jgi:hypothetical protein
MPWVHSQKSRAGACTEHDLQRCNFPSFSASALEEQDREIPYNISIKDKLCFLPHRDYSLTTGTFWVGLGEELEGLIIEMDLIVSSIFALLVRLGCYAYYNITCTPG